MVLRLVIWNLADSQTNVGELRRYLRDSRKNSDIVEVFDLEASVSAAEELRRLGLAFE
jgi:hypothetical protein